MDNDNKRVDLSELTMVETNEKIVKIFGEYEDLVTTNILLQNEVNGFPYLKQKDRKDLLNKINRLNIFDDLHQTILKKKYDNDVELRFLDKNKEQSNLVTSEEELEELKKDLSMDYRKSIEIKRQIDTKQARMIMLSKSLSKNSYAPITWDNTDHNQRAMDLRKPYNSMQSINRNQTH
jgi:DNA repair exonuclease SbcCD ATPase subunit